jgi:hypothetical protein
MSDDRNQVILTVPWSDGRNSGDFKSNGGAEFSDGGWGSAPLVASQPTTEFIQARTHLHEVYILQMNKTKRLGLTLSAALLVIACILPIFAPQGRETLSYFISLSLLVFSAGAAGFTSIWFKTKLKEIKFDAG